MLLLTAVVYLIVISSTASGLNALSPSVRHQSRLTKAVGFASHYQHPRYSTHTTRPQQPLSYRIFPKGASPKNIGSSSNISDTSELLVPLDIDFDHIQKIDALDSINRHVQSIVTVSGSDFFSTEEVVVATAADDEDGHNAIQQTSSKINNETPGTTIAIDTPSSSSKARTSSTKSETNQMIAEISAIALPSLGGMLLDPIMSLIDTACVGQVSTTMLAAMAPATSIFQFAFFAFFFLSAATTNLVASNPPEVVYDSANPTSIEEAAQRVDFNERVVSNAAALAVILGVVLTTAIIQYCDSLLTLAGIPASNVSLMNAARPYLIIRAFGLPFVFLATVLQGSSLGRGNAWRPLKIFGTAGFINLIGDVYLTLFKGWGAVGAAAATVAAQVGAAVYYAISSSRLEKSVEESSKPLRDVALVWRGLPSKQIVNTFLTVAMALFSRSIGLMLAFSMLTRTAALSGEVALAAHQVTLQIWWLLSFLPEPMAVAAQTLITRDMKDRKSRVPKLINTLYKMCGVLGISAAIVTGVILKSPAIAGALVADPSVQRMMASLLPFAVLSQSYCPLATLSDGVCIGLGAFSHLPIIMIGSFITTAAGLALVTRQNMGIIGVWACLNVFMSSRIAGHLLLSTRLRKYVKKAFGGGKKKKKKTALQ